MNPTPLDRTFSALGDPARRRILERLAEGPRSAGSLAQPFDVSRPAISRHLRVLREAGLVTVERSGRERLYSIAPETLREAQVWMEEVQQMWTEALGSLKSFVEGGP